MTFRLPHAAVMTALAVVTAACGAGEPASPAVRLARPDSGPAYVEVTGLSAATLASLAAGTRTPEQWASILRVAVTADSPPVVGDYRVADGALRFTPAFPFDPGRPYAVRVDPAAAGDPEAPIIATLALPASGATATTTVAEVYPSGETVPENLLRMYIHFSAPMGLSSGIAHVELLDAAGEVVEGAFLPLDYEFWDAERQRFTAFLDPGRVKRGILPNRQSGRAMTRGGRYTLVVKPAWRDSSGQPLATAFRKTFTAGPAEMQPLDTAHWKVDAPRRTGPSGPAGDDTAGRQPLVVTFPKPLDRGLLLRALGVRLDGQAVDGDARVEAAETRWVFTPRRPWSTGRYELVALSILEDPAGNQIGRAFEVDNFEAVDKSPDPKTIAVPFVVGQ